MSPADTFRIMVVGNKHVGKSALVVKYLTGRFIGEYQSDKEHKYKTNVTLDGEDFSVEISDSSDPDDNIINWADGFMIVYDITQSMTFEKITQLKKDLEYKKSAKNISYVVVGNKIDLKHCRQVPKESAEKLCLDIPAAHFECCACAGNDDEETATLREAFEELCREIKRQKCRSVNKVERRKSIIGGLRRFVPSNKSKQYSSTTGNASSSLTVPRSGNDKSLRRRKSVASLIGIPDRSNRSRSPIPTIRVEDPGYVRSQTLGRSVCSYGVDGLA